MEDFYDLLGVSEDASTEEIDRAWRRKVRTYHPDVNDDARANAQFKTLKKAHEVLADETERTAYDRMGHESYVQRRLEGLPTKGTPRKPDAATETTAGAAAEAEAKTTSAADEATSDDGATNGDSTGDSDAGTNARDRSADRGTGARRTSGERTRRRTSDGSERSGRRSSGGARASASGGGRGSYASTASGGQGTAGNATTKGSNDRGQESTAATRSGGRLTPLSYGWTAVLLAGVLYVAGLWQYLRSNAEALSILRRTAAADPIAAATATHELVAPGRFVLESVAADEPLTLLFPVGAVALAVALVGVVHSFGRGVAYLYALGGLVPILALAAGPVVTLPDGAILGLVCVCPLLATAGFLVDVGRVAF